jgi:hemolysin activation/secretion protein
MPTIKRLSGAALTTLAIISSSSAFATSVPSSADVSRVEGNIKQSLPEVKNQAPVDVKGNAPFTAPAGSEKITFVLKDITLEGLTIYKPGDIKTVYAPKINTKISLKDVYAIAATLTAKYRNDGYILTQVIVPPQTIADGTVKLRVVEGRINQIKVDGPGAQGTNADIINLYVSRLKSQNVLNNQSLERTILLINDLPGVTAKSVLSPSTTTDGASDLTIFVDRKAADANVKVDNFGSRFLGRWEALAGASLNSALGYNERISAQMAYAPSDQGFEPELLYGELSSSVPVGAYGTSLEFNIGKSRTEPGNFLDQFNVKGTSYFTGMKVQQPIIRTRALNVSSSLGLDRKSTKTKSNVDTNKDDDLTSLRLGGHVDVIDTLFSAAVTSANIEISHGLTILGASETGDPDLSRPDADVTYTKFTGNLTRLERIANDIALQTSIKGQLSNAALLSAEEFGLGGMNSIGRGYDPSEITGDDGIAGSMELQWSTPYAVTWLDNYTVYGFYDIGKVMNSDATASIIQTESLASVGAGIRADITKTAHTEFMVATPLTHSVAAENDSDPRFFISFSKDF